MTKDAVGSREELASAVAVRTGVDRPLKYPLVHLQAEHLQIGKMDVRKIEHIYIYCTKYLLRNNIPQRKWLARDGKIANVS